MSGATFKPSDPVDFLVIGAGAAGGVMAKELSTAGFSVVVLEQGPYLTEKDYRHDEIRYNYLAGLTSDQQIQLIRNNEQTEFFELLRTHTLYGFLGNPSYGGNRDRVGWKLIGFEDRMVFQHPFGYYDTDGGKA